MDDALAFRRGTTPLLVSFPHDGISIPESLERRMTTAALARPDTDWHVAKLYEFVGSLGASTLRPRTSRYVVDLNRDPTGAELYPGADNTGIVPLHTFDREPIYQAGQEPGADEAAERVDRWFAPYHEKLSDEVERLVSNYGVAVVLDAHTIRSRVPRFFDGELPDLNLGTGDGTSADESLSVRVYAVLAGADGYSAVRDGRFKGGYITRHYGQPDSDVHVIQLELAQKNYMTEAPPFAFDAGRAERLRAVLRRFVGVLSGWARERAG